MSDQPNILFLFPDQWRWDWLGCEDSPFGKVPVRTPNIDKLAARGVRFTQCRTNSPLCAPARACLATGRRYERCGVPSNGFDLHPSADTVFQRLRAAGYRVACSGKTDLLKHRHWKGLEGWTQAIGRLGFTESANQCGKHDAVNSGFPEPVDLYMARLHRVGLAKTHRDDYHTRNTQTDDGIILGTRPSPLPREHYTDDVCGAKALEFLETWSTAPPDRPAEPWMLWVNFPGPHEPFDPPAELAKLYAGVDFSAPIHAQTAHGRLAAEQDHAQLRRNYAAMITGIDQWVGRLIEAIERRGELDNTLIVFSSDHGEMLGDHGRWYKAVPHEASVHVPLIVAGPGVRRGAVSEALVELIDVSATLLDVAGLAAPDDWDARSVRPMLHGRGNDSSHRDTQVSALGDWQLAFDGRFKLVRCKDQADQLFDLKNDPAESHDVSAAHAEDVTRLGRVLDACAVKA